MHHFVAQVRDRRRIRNRYLTTEFPIDVMGVTPLDIFARFTGETSELVAYLRIPKLVRGSHTHIYTCTQHKVSTCTCMHT